MYCIHTVDFQGSYNIHDLQLMIASFERHFGYLTLKFKSTYKIKKNSLQTNEKSLDANNKVGHCKCQFYLSSSSSLKKGLYSEPSSINKSTIRNASTNWKIPYHARGQKVLSLYWDD